MPAITQRVTYAELTALIASASLNAGLNYLITDRGDRGLLFKAASTTQLEIQGTRYMLCPATYAIGADAHGNNWIGVWNNTKTAALNNLAIWNGQVWKCILAVTEPLDSPDFNATNWELIPKASFANHEYIEMIFTVSYDVANDWICKQFDDKGNVFGISYLEENDPDYGMYYGYNLCDYSDWNRAIEGKGFYNNKAAGVINCNEDCKIADNITTGQIANNVCIEISQNICYTGGIYNNKCGFISLNICKTIVNNSNNGDISGNSNNGDISGNSNNGGISGNSNNGGITSNSNKGYIVQNSNNGDITSNSSSVACNIYVNINNGLILGEKTDHVTDTVVNKA